MVSDARGSVASLTLVTWEDPGYFIFGIYLLSLLLLLSSLGN